MTGALIPGNTAWSCRASCSAAFSESDTAFGDGTERCSFTWVGDVVGTIHQRRPR
jgi:hypothetical protein